MELTMKSDHCEDHSGNCAMITEHDKKIDDLYAKWNTLQWWLIGISLSSTGTLFLVVVGLVLNKK
jgi:hypothetical protein